MHPPRAPLPHSTCRVPLSPPSLAYGADFAGLRVSRHDAVTDSSLGSSSTTGTEGAELALALTYGLDQVGVYVMADSESTGLRWIVGKRLLCRGEAVVVSLNCSSTPPPRPQTHPINLAILAGGHREPVAWHPRAAITQGSTLGRGGRGAVYVVGSGSGRAAGGRADYNARTAHPAVVVVAALSPWGRATSYGERGSAVLVSAPSSAGLTGLGAFPEC